MPLQRDLTNLLSTNLSIVHLMTCSTEYNSQLQRNLSQCARQISAGNVANNSREKAGARGSAPACVIVAPRDLARSLRFGGWSRLCWWQLRRSRSEDI